MCTFLVLQFCCVVGWHNLIILWGDRAIYPEKGLLATNYQGKTISLLTLQRRDRSRDKILISKYCISYLSAYCTGMYRGRAACYWLDIDLCLSAPWKEKVIDHSAFLLCRFENWSHTFHFTQFLFRFVWIQPWLGLGVTSDWNQRKNFHFHIPNQFHIRPLFYNLFFFLRKA